MHCYGNHSQTTSISTAPAITVLELADPADREATGEVDSSEISAEQVLKDLTTGRT